MQVVRTMLVLLTLPVVAACADTNLIAPDTGTTASTAAAVRTVAQGFALALADPQIRSDVRDAMRASDLTDHKLELQAFVATPAGERLVRVAAAALGGRGSAFESALASLPAMDFYAPFRMHRQTWQGTSNIVVAGSPSDEFTTLSGFDVNGATLAFDVRTGTPSRPVLVIHPAEAKVLRRDRENRGSGAVIQEPGEQDLGVALVVDPTQPRYVMQDCGPDALVECGEEGAVGGAPTPTDTTFVDYLSVYYDDGCGSCSVEVELRASYYENGVEVASRTYRITGVYKNMSYYPHEPLIFRLIQEGINSYIRIHVVETDGISGDDDKGTRNFFASDRAQIRSIMHNGTTNVELDWIPEY